VSHRLITNIFFLVLTFLIASCGSNTIQDGAPIPRSESSAHPSDPLPKNEPRSRYGNGPYYRVLGKTYRVLDTSYGYQERGVASWYGTKFHGRITSSGEPYDMYAMTAAHKSLPLPTYVRVRNLKNNRSIIVRVNDRGPFVDNRLIDLSYSAARKLDMIRDGTSLVEVTAITYDSPLVAEQTEQTNTTTKTIISSSEKRTSIFVQVGAFSDFGNAKRRHTLIQDGGIGAAFVDQDKASTEGLYRVKIGPIDDVIQYDHIVKKLQRLGITETHLVTD